MQFLLSFFVVPCIATSSTLAPDARCEAAIAEMRSIAAVCTNDQASAEMVEPFAVFDRIMRVSAVYREDCDVTQLTTVIQELGREVFVTCGRRFAQLRAASLREEALETLNNFEDPGETNRKMEAVMNMLQCEDIRCGMGVEMDDLVEFLASALGQEYIVTLRMRCGLYACRNPGVARFGALTILRQAAERRGLSEELSRYFENESAPISDDLSDLLGPYLHYLSMLEGRPCLK